MSLAAAGAVGVFIWRQRQQAAGTSASTTAATSSAYGEYGGGSYGANQGVLQAEIQQLQGEVATGTSASTSAVSTSTPATTATTTPATTTATPAPAPSVTPAATATVPNVVGQRANTGIGIIVSDGFTWVSTTGDRDPKACYKIGSQSPKGGTKAAKGSKISVAFTIIPC